MHSPGPGNGAGLAALEAMQMAYRRAVYPSGNTKTGVMAATYMPVKGTCDVADECPLRGSGCYAESGHVGLHQRRLESATMRPADHARAAAAELMRLAASGRVPQGTPARWAVSGDVADDAGAHAVAQVAEVWSEVVKGPVYGYTHTWRKVKAHMWGKAVVRASCESLSDAKRALAEGYLPAIVVPSHPADGRARVVDGVRIVPCPAQTRDTKCTDCGLCWRTTPGTAIAFAVHGASKKRALSVLK